MVFELTVLNKENILGSVINLTLIVRCALFMKLFNATVLINVTRVEAVSFQLLLIFFLMVLIFFSKNCKNLLHAEWKTKTSITFENIILIMN